MKTKDLALIICLINILGCVTITNPDYKNLNEHLRAENHLMKSRTVLLERENSVLKDENLQAKKEIQQLNAGIEKLSTEMDSFKQKYQKDMALSENRYKNLEQKNAIMEKESTSKIQELTALNKSIETKLSGEIANLNNSIKLQQDAFSKEREKLRNESTEKELSLTRQIDELKKTLAERDSEIAALKSSNSEMDLKLKEALKSIEQNDKMKETPEKEDRDPKINAKSDSVKPDTKKDTPPVNK